MPQSSVINDLLSVISDTRLFGERRRQRRLSRDEVSAMIGAVLSGRGEASSTERIGDFLDAFRTLDSAGRTFVFRTLASDYGPDAERLKRAATTYLNDPSAANAKALQRAAEPRRVEFFRRLNQVAGGTQALCAMRSELLARLANHPDLWMVDDDLKRMFSAWFNRGFLVLRDISWQTSAAILEKIIRYEAVHAINGWDDLRNRIDVPDRRLYAFFHPRLGDEPVIFVEVALLGAMPSAIAPILATGREPLDPTSASVAAFYSINNCQDGLRGIHFGSFLIKQVASDLKRELPELKTFVTLSPMPGFARWLREEAARPESVVDPAVRERLSEWSDATFLDDADARKAAEAALMPLAAHYLMSAKDGRGLPVDPVARFHLGNGARLERINFAGDVSDRGLTASHGLMVNYRYELSEVEKNHEAFVNEGKIAVAPVVTRLTRSLKLTEREPAAADDAPAALPAPAAPAKARADAGEPET